MVIGDEFFFLELELKHSTLPIEFILIELQDSKTITF